MSSLLPNQQHWAPKTFGEENALRRMKLGSVLVFLALISAPFSLAALATSQLLNSVPPGDFRGVAMSIFAIFTFYLLAILVFRVFLGVCPLPSGEIPEGSRSEFIYHVYLLFYLLVFNPIIFCGAVPIPLMRLFYQGLGATMGTNSFSVGIMLDPQFVEIGSNSIIGNGALLIPHIIEGKRLAHYPVRIGNNVTVGAHSVVLAGVEIGDGAIVAINSVVTKGSRIPAGETWGGTPARRLVSAPEKNLG